MKEKRNWKETLRVLKFVGFSISAGVIEIVTFTLLDQLTNWHYWPKYNQSIHDINDAPLAGASFIF